MWLLFFNLNNKNKMKTNAVIIFFILLTACGCIHKKNSFVPTKKLDTVWLNTVIEQSDSFYSKPYKRTDFVTAYFYIGKKDSSICQVMKDSAGQVRQVLITKKNNRFRLEQYYANGQLIAAIPINKNGVNHGTATYYFENGKVKTTGNFNAGLYEGVWHNFNENGKEVAPTTYDVNGNIKGQ